MTPITAVGRVCAVCNLHETSKSAREEVYEHLVEGDMRLVRRDLRKGELLPKWHEQEWFEVAVLQQLFEASAGGINICWPEFVYAESASTL